MKEREVLRIESDFHMHSFLYLYSVPLKLALLLMFSLAWSAFLHGVLLRVEVAAHALAQRHLDLEGVLMKVEHVTPALAHVL